MDKIDYKILQKLDINTRATLAELGKAARVSKEVAQYRLKRLIDNKIITGFYAFVDIPRLGYFPVKILVKYKSVTNEIQEEIKKYVLTNKTVAWSSTCKGTYDFLMTLVPKSRKELKEVYTEFFSKFGSYFKQKHVLSPYGNQIFNDKYLSNEELKYAHFIDMTPKIEVLDKKDEEILRQISLNSRQTFTELGKKIGLSYWATAQRYKELKKKKFILREKPRIDFRKLGLDYYHVFLELQDESKIKEINEYYKHHFGCIAIMNHAGYYSLHLEFVIKKEDIDIILSDLREKFGNDLMSYEPLLIKEEYIMNILR